MSYATKTRDKECFSSTPSMATIIKINYIPQEEILNIAFPDIIECML